MQNTKKSKLVRYHTKLNTKPINTLPSLIYTLSSYTKLIKKAPSPIILSIFYRIMTLFFRMPPIYKHTLIKFLQKHHTYFKDADYTFYKHDIINYIYSTNRLVSKSVIKLIKLSKTLLYDDEILCEFIGKQRKASYFSKLKIENKEKLVEGVTSGKKYCDVRGNLKEMIDYVSNNCDKNVIKLVAEFPVLIRYMKKDFRVYDKQFLSVTEAQNLYKFFRIYVPAWNQSNLKIYKYNENCKLSEMLIFLESFLQKNRIADVITILEKLKNAEGLRIDYKVLMDALYARVTEESVDEIRLVLYGLNKNSYYLKMSKLIDQMLVNHKNRL